MRHSDIQLEPEKGVPRRERKAAVESAMERCGVTEVRRKLVGHVSRGYRQRVGLADALVARPPILILDEPTLGLDPNQRRRMKALIRELADEHTILFSSHILAEVGEVSSRILIISNGKLRADGTVDDLLRQAPGRCLNVSTRAPADQLESVVRQVVGDEAAITVGDDGDGWTRLSLATGPDDDPREPIAVALQQHGLTTRELGLDLPTLERYFQHVTEEAIDS